jgi:hypothetical protein
VAIKRVSAKICPHYAGATFRQTAERWEPELKIHTMDGKKFTLSTLATENALPQNWVVLHGDPRDTAEVKIERFMLNHPWYQTDELRAHLENHVAQAIVNASSARCVRISMSGSRFYRDNKPTGTSQINFKMGNHFNFAGVPKGLGSTVYFKGKPP